MPGRALAALSAVVLGYDVPPEDQDAALSEYLAVREQTCPRPAESVMAQEVSLLETFADLAELTRNRPGGRGPADRAARAQLARALPHLPAEPRRRARRAARAVPRAAGARAPALRRRGRRPHARAGGRGLPHLPGPAADDARGRARLRPARLLEPRDPADRAARLPGPRGAGAPRSRPAVALPGGRRPGPQRALPLVRPARRGRRALRHPPRRARRARRARRRLQSVASRASRPPTQRIEALVNIPEQIVGFLAERLEQGIPAREPMLEVLARRHYREYELHDLQSFDGDVRPAVVASYTLDDRPTRLVTSVGTVAELVDGSANWSSTVAELVEARAPHEEAVVDLYLHWADVPSNADEASERLRTLLTALPLAHDVRRVCVAVCSGAERPVGYYVFRPAADGSVVEDDLTRGVHPMVGRRLDLWRLRNFHVTRVEAPEDVLLYECVARENPADRRLVALAQVRQMSVVRDEDGTITALPHAERAVENCLESIRRERVARGTDGAKLDMNHVWVHVWPVVDLDLDGLSTLGTKISPLTDGAGIEEVVAQGRLAVPGGEPVALAVRFGAQPGAGIVSTVEEPPTELLKPLDDYASKVVRSRRRGLVYPYELSGVLAGPGGTLVEHDLDDTGNLVPVDRPYGLNTAGILAAVVIDPDAAAPRGREARGALRRPDEVAGLGRGAGVPAGDRGARPGRAARRTGGVVRALRGRADLDGLRHREHGLGGQGAAPDRGVHPGRRRDQRRGRRHQRRRAAVLERRGHDADAHQGHPGDDPGERDGAHRQAVARLLRRRLGRGQLRHRRLRPGDGSQRAGAVLGARPGRRLRRADGALRAHLRRAGGERPAARSHHRPCFDRDISSYPALGRGQRLPAPSARSSPPRPTRTARRPSTSAR